MIAFLVFLSNKMDMRYCLSYWNTGYSVKTSTFLGRFTLKYFPEQQRLYHVNFHFSSSSPIDLISKLLFLHLYQNIPTRKKGLVESLKIRKKRVKNWNRSVIRIFIQIVFFNDLVKVKCECDDCFMTSWGNSCSIVTCYYHDALVDKCVSSRLFIKSNWFSRFDCCVF